MKGLLLLAILQQLKAIEKDYKTNDKSFNGSKTIYFMKREDKKFSEQQKISKQEHQVTCVWPTGSCTCGVTTPLKSKL